MPKYLLKVNYVGDGLKGLIKEGGVARRAAAEKAVASGGGRIEAFYFAFGDADAYVIADVPDQSTMAAMSLAINGSGLVRLKTTALMTAEDMDAAVKKSLNYRGPGQ